MSSVLEASLIQHLLEIDSVNYLVTEGFSPTILPSQAVWPVYEYAVNYYLESGKTRAVTQAALETQEVSAGRSMLDLLNDLEIPLDDPELSISDCVMKLRSQFVLKSVNSFNRVFATEMAEAGSGEKETVLATGVTFLSSLSSSLTRRRYRLDARDGLKERWEAYGDRAKGGDENGMAFGIKPLDEHFRFLRPGELAIFGAAPKTGKSWITLIVALAEWRRGRSVALFSLENSIDMTLDRLACAAVGVDYSRFQKGACNEGEIQRIEEFIKQMETSDNPIWVMHPPRSERTAEHMLRQAAIMDADSVIIDQISHVDHPDPGRKPRWEQVRDIMQDLKLIASTGATPLPVLAMHQISREGKKDADKRGYHEMMDFAESSEIERSADLALTLHQTVDGRRANEALLQIVAGRRVDTKKWSTIWYPALGHMQIRGELP